MIRRLLERLPAVLEAGGVALLEIGADEGDAMTTAVASLLPGWRCEIRPDLAGLARLARVERGEPRDHADRAAHGARTPDRA